MLLLDTGVRTKTEACQVKMQNSLVCSERYGTDKTQIRLGRFYVGEFGLLSLF